MSCLNYTTLSSLKQAWSSLQGLQMNDKDKQHYKTLLESVVSDYTTEREEFEGSTQMRFIYDSHTKPESFVKIFDEGPIRIFVSEQMRLLGASDSQIEEEVNRICSVRLIR